LSDGWKHENTRKIKLKLYIYHVTITNDWYFIKIFVALIVYSDRHHVWCKKSTKHGKSQEGIEIKYV